MAEVSSNLLYSKYHWLIKNSILAWKESRGVTVWNSIRTILVSFHDLKLSIKCALLILHCHRLLYILLKIISQVFVLVTLTEILLSYDPNNYNVV